MMLRLRLPEQLRSVAGRKDLPTKRGMGILVGRLVHLDRVLESPCLVCSSQQLAEGPRRQGGVTTWIKTKLII